MKLIFVATILLLVIVGSWWTLSQRNGTPGAVVGEVVVTEGDAESEQTVGDVLRGGRGEMIVVYDGISAHSDTQKLDLSNRGLSGSLKAEIRHLTELRELDISNNAFTGLPAEVGQLQKLQRLDLSNNPFTGLPHELGNLHDLQQLDLRGTQYAEYDLEIIKATLPSTVEILTD